MSTESRITLNRKGKDKEIFLKSDNAINTKRRFLDVKDQIAREYGSEIEVTNAQVINILLDIYDLHKENG